ncbi:MAG: hypothetical protein ACYC61_07105 [Isosphaeraceae bacterium]
MLDFPAARAPKEREREVGRLEEQLRTVNDLNAELVRNNARLIEVCTTDELTGVKNRW